MKMLKSQKLKDSDKSVALLYDVELDKFCLTMEYKNVSANVIQYGELEYFDSFDLANMMYKYELIMNLI